MQKWNWPHSRGWTGITIDDCWKGWAILLRQKQKKLIMLPSETMIWQPEFTDKTLSRKPGAVHTDYTPVKVLAPGLKKTKTGRIWTYVRDDRNAGSSSPPAVWFAYSPNRQGKHPGQHLRPFRGILQADAFTGYDRLFSAEREGGALTEVACWTHARRKFAESHI